MKPVDDNEAGCSGHSALSGFARKLFAEWRCIELPRRDAPVVVAVSGGGDSTALLLALDELQRARRLALQFVVAHLDHGLQGDQGHTERVAALAAKCGFAFETKRIDVGERADVLRDNLEQTARRIRYEFLGEVALAVEASFILVAHTLDDQAETIMLRLMRGSGAEGLSGMRTLRPLREAANETASDNAQKNKILVVRPLLGWARRATTETYCRERGEPVVSDWMNEDHRFARVRVRKELLPLLRSFNPRIEEALARTASLLREDATTLDAAASSLLQEATDPQTDSPANKIYLDVRVLAAAPVALQRRALRLWLRAERGHLRRIEETHIRAVQGLLAGERGGRVVEIPGGGRVERRKGRLRFLA